MMKLITLLLLVFWHQVSSNEFLYSEIEYLGGSCDPWDNCKSTRLEHEDHLWGNYSCECGEHCIRYGTCCADSTYSGKVLHVPYRGETCKKLKYVSDAVVMVSRCPERWRNEFETLQKCVAPEEDTEDPVSATPVTSLETGVTYKNFFCAICNHDYRNIYLWNITVGLNAKRPIQKMTQQYFMNNMVYNKEKKAWGVVIDDDFLKLNLRFEVPENVRKLVKKCYRNMVFKCHPSFADNIFHSKCWSYYSPIQIKKDVKHAIIYRNIHCAICNNVTVTEDDTNVCKLGVHVRERTKPRFSFALLLDINREDGELVGLRQLCKNEEKWDPFFKKCRSLVCVLPGYVVKNGSCVPVEES